MCFSPEADVVAGIVVGTVGIDALRHVTRPPDRLLATIPVILGVHQLIEALVWLGLQGRLPATVWHPARWLYLAIALGLLPVLVPLAIRALQPAATKRRLDFFVVLGGFVAVLLMIGVVRGPLASTIEGHHIAYQVELWQGGYLTALYVVATCGGMLVSRDRNIRYFGVVNLPVVLLLAWLTESGFISLWCAWAAVTSIVIATHLRHRSRPIAPKPQPKPKPKSPAWKQPTGNTRAMRWAGRR